MESDQSLSDWSDDEEANTRLKEATLIADSATYNNSSSDSEEAAYSSSMPAKDFHCYNLTEALMKPYVPIRSINQPIVITQPALMEELRWLLCGARTSGVFLEVDGDIKLHPCCECKEISHAILSSYFQVYFVFVKDFRLLQDFVNIEGFWSRTHEALKLWLSRFLSQYLMFVTELQSRSLLEMRVKWMSKHDELRPVFNCLKTLVNFGPPTVNVFDTVTRILSTVYDTLDNLSFHADDSVLEYLLDLLTSLLHPHVNLIDNWIRTGLVNDPFREFFVITTHSAKNPFKKLTAPCYFLDTLFDDLLKASKAKEMLLKMSDSVAPLEPTVGDSLHMELLNLIFTAEENPLEMPVLSNGNFQRSSHFDFSINVPGERQHLMSQVFHKRSMRTSLKPLVLKDVATRFHLIVRNRCAQISQDLMSSLKNRCHLPKIMSEISMIFSLFALDDLCSVLFEKILEGETWHDHETLVSYLQSSLAQTGYKDTDKRWSCSATFQEGTIPTEGLKCLDSFRFSLTLDWPIHKIITSRHLEMYNRVSLFLLQIQFSRYVLCTSRFPQNSRSGRISQTHRRLLMVRFEMISFLNAIFSTIVYQFWSTWDADSVLNSPDFDAAVDAHDLLVSRLYHMALQTKNLTVLHGPICKVFRLTLKLRELLCLSESVSESKVIKIQDEFSKCRSFLLTIIRLKLGDVPQQGLYYQLAPESEIHDPDHKIIVHLKAT